MVEPHAKRTLRTRLLATFGWNLLATGVVLLLSAATGAVGLDTLASRVVVAFVYSNCIGTLIGLSFEYGGFGDLVARNRFPLNWLLLAGGLFAMTAAGCAIAAAVLVAAGLFEPGSYWETLRGSVAFAFAVALILGVGGFVWDRLGAQLARAEVELERKRLAEESALKLAAEARLSALEARVHPHFLFNTLNSIASLVREDPARAELTLERLAALLRFSLYSAREGTVPLAEELGVVRKYLEIERVRFGERLRYEIDADERLGEVEVPAFALQTLVENGVKHAVAPSRGGATIRVSVRAAGDAAVVEVSDDGPGFGEAGTKPGHGLASLRERLAALYGAEASLGVARRDGRTVVEVSVPARRAVGAAR